MLGDTRTEFRTSVMVEPERFKSARFQRTLLYEVAMEQGVPVQWKEGKAPKNREATEADLEWKNKTNGRLRVHDNTLEAVWI